MISYQMWNLETSNQVSSLLVLLSSCSSRDHCVRNRNVVCVVIRLGKHDFCYFGLFVTEFSSSNLKLIQDQMSVLFVISFKELSVGTFWCLNIFNACVSWSVFNCADCSLSMSMERTQFAENWKTVQFFPVKTCVFMLSKCAVLGCQNMQF